MKRTLILLSLSLPLLMLLSIATLAEQVESDQEVLPPSTFIPPTNGPDDGVLKKKPVVEDLGDGSYRIGRIIVDKKKGRFTLPGVVLPYDEGKPLEFIAVTKGGLKAYESLLELEANAFEFNLACILIGLDETKAKGASFHFDPEPIQGDPVSIRVSWEQDGERKEVDPIQWLKSETKPPVPTKWNYTGSQFVEGNRYLAQMDGTLIGLVHDPASIIEHHTGIGLGNWGQLSIDLDKTPSSGAKIDLTVQRLNP